MLYACYCINNNNGITGVLIYKLGFIITYTNACTGITKNIKCVMLKFLIFIYEKYVAFVFVLSQTFVIEIEQAKT